ncbi:MAG: tetratricopeptide repeat protein [Mucilaginibacter sp.]
MDIYLTIEEKYLQAVDELSYGENPKALQLLNAIITDEPFYARAHYQLGKLYYYEVNDYQAAGYHFKTCVELEPSFADVYYHYLHLLVFLNMERQVHSVIEKALMTPGVCAACIYDLKGLFAEKNKDWENALVAYQKGFLEATCKTERDDIEQSIERVRAKKRQSKKYNYELSN